MERLWRRRYDSNRHDLNRLTRYGTMDGAFPTLERIQEESWRILRSGTESDLSKLSHNAAILKAMEQHTQISEDISALESLIAETKDLKDRQNGESELAALKQQLAALEGKLTDFEREPDVAQRFSVIVQWRPETESPVATALIERLLNELQRYCESASWKYRDVTIHELVPPAERRRDLAKTVAASLRCLWIEGPEVWYRLRWEAAQYTLPDRSPLLTVRVYPLIDEGESPASGLAYRQVAHPVLPDRASVCVLHEASGIEVFAEEASARRMRSSGAAYLRSRLFQSRKAGPLPTRVLHSGVMSIRDERLGDSVYPPGRDSLATRIEALLTWSRPEARTLSNENSSR